MTSMTPPIRNAARALIVRDGKILLLRKAGYPGGERYALPGGGQDLGETLEQALVRECHEEIGTSINIHGLVHVADCFKPRDTSPPSTRHMVEFLFECSIPEDYVARNGHQPDKHQVAVDWISLDGLMDTVLYPRALATYLRELPDRSSPLYLGLIDW